MEWHEHMALRAALDWQIEAGVLDAIQDETIDRYAIAPQPKPAPPARPAQSNAAAPQAQAAPAAKPEVDAVAVAQAAASGAATLEALRAAFGSYEHCELRRGARNLVFSDGRPGARVMIIGEAPGRDEDREARPFVGRAGQLLDKMLGAIGLERSNDVYITNVLPWRPPQNRDPLPEEIDMMRPFVARHVALAEPDVLLLMGNISCQAGMGKRGITRLRGTWTEAYGMRALPMFHPAYLLRNPIAKREAWADLLTLKAHLEAGT